MRGPLDPKTDESVVSYILSIQEKLAKLSEIVQQNLQRAQNRHARTREFKSDDEVLVLLPTSTSKLLAEWQGPYSIIKPVGKVTYEVDMHDRRKRKRVFHVNMLKKWETPTDFAMFNDEVDPSDEIVLWRDATENQQPAINSSLTPTQLQELHHTLQSFSNVLNSEPGRTTSSQ